jgi:hypothetical protein
VATDLVKYYNTTGRDLTAANIQWTSVMRNFETQWKALKAKKDDDTPDVPKITRSLPVIKWTEAFQDFLCRVIGTRTVPLSYVIRPEADVPAAAPPLAPNQPHSAEHGSVEDELVARASHDHALFRDDNASVYHYLEEATRATSYAASIKPFQRRKDGRGAWLAIVSQYAGVDKWEAEIKKQEKLLHTRVWKGQSNMSLEQFVSQHRNAFVSMQQCASHVEYQLPNEHSRVGFLLEALQCADPGLQAAMASVRTDNGPDGMRNNFESAVAHLLPYDPVAKKRAQGTKRDQTLISDTTAGVADVADAAAKKPSIGKTGVHLRFHTKEEYAKLTPAQKSELYEWRGAHPDERRPGKKGSKGKRQRGNLSSLVSKKIKEEIAKQAGEQREQEDGEAYIMSLIQKAMSDRPGASVSASSSNPATTPAVTLKSILKRAKNSKT